MSAGVFEVGKYESNSGRVYPCTAQEETKGLVLDGTQNEYPAGAVTEEVSAKLSGGKREIGCIARKVTLRWTGAPPAGYDPASNVVVPMFTQAIAAKAVRGNTGTYLGQGVEVRGSTSEALN